MIWTLACCLTLPQFQFRFNFLQEQSMAVKQAVTGLAIALTGAVLANVCRIVVLCVLVVFENPLGIDVLQDPAHGMIGLLALLGFVILPLAVWAKGNLMASVEMASFPTYSLTTSSLSYSQFLFQRRLQRIKALIKTNIEAALFRLIPSQIPAYSGVLACLVALLIVNLPHQPMDVSAEKAWQTLPSRLAGFSGKTVPLNPVESHYFQKFGGNALKVRYGQTAVMLVQTTSPLRHLHDPGDCLRGMGYDVRFIGRQQEPYPSNRFMATAPSGQRYWVDVVFKSNSGQIVTSVSEAILLWIQQPQIHWMAIQRIRPVQTQPDKIGQDLRLATELGQILDLQVNASTPEAATPSWHKTLTAWLPLDMMPHEISLTQARDQDVIPDYVLSQNHTVQNHTVYMFKEDYDVP
jgi:hypothetical protein